MRILSGLLLCLGLSVPHAPSMASEFNTGTVLPREMSEHAKKCMEHLQEGAGVDLMEALPVPILNPYLVALWRTKDHYIALGAWLASSYAVMGLHPDQEPTAADGLALQDFLEKKIMKHYPDSKLAFKDVATRFILLNEAGKFCSKDFFGKGNLFLPESVGELFPKRSMWVANAPISAAIQMMDLPLAEQDVELFQDAFVQQDTYQKNLDTYKRQSLENWEARKVWIKKGASQN